MKRQSTSQEFNSNNHGLHHDLQEQVMLFLQERESTSESCQLLLAEIQMLLAMFEDAKIHFMINNNNNKNKDDDNDDDSNNNNSSSSVVVVPAINISVPLRTLQGDGESTLAFVLLSIVLEEPHLYPNSEAIAIRFKSPQLSPHIRSDLGDSLLEYTKELQNAGSLSIG